MKVFLKKTYDRLYTIGILIKAISTVAEIVLGTLLYFVSSDTINRVIFFVFGDELTEHPNDWFWNIFFHGFNGISPSTQSFWAFILLSHGIAKIFFVIGLLKNKLWAYPASAIVFAGFVVYQIQSILVRPSFFLYALTIFDVVLIGLILYEYRQRLQGKKLAEVL